MSVDTRSQILPAVCTWLEDFLKDRLPPQAEIRVFDTSATLLGRAISAHAPHTSFSSEVWRNFNFKVDVTGLVTANKRTELVFINCTAKPVTLKDVSELLGYSRVALPVLSLLLSPGGISDAVLSLALRYDRADVFLYNWPQGRNPTSIIVARWDLVSQAPDILSVIPPSALSGLKIEI